MDPFIWVVQKYDQLTMYQGMMAWWQNGVNINAHDNVSLSIHSRTVFTVQFNHDWCASVVLFLVQNSFFSCLPNPQTLFISDLLAEDGSGGFSPSHLSVPPPPPCPSHHLPRRQLPKRWFVSGAQSAWLQYWSTIIISWIKICIL